MDVIVLILSQEVWLGNDELVDMYEKRLRNANYTLFKLARTNNRGDGEFSFPIPAWYDKEKRPFCMDRTM